MTEKDLQLAKTSYILENYYGTELSKANKLEDAEKHYKKSIELYPDFGLGWNNLGSVLMKQANINSDQEKIEEAHADLTKAIEYLPTFDTPYENMAILMEKHSEVNEAEKFIKEALENFPNNYKLWALLSSINIKQNNFIEANHNVRKSLILNPSCTECRKIYNYIQQNKPKVQN